MAAVAPPALDLCRPQRGSRLSAAAAAAVGDVFEVVGGGERRGIIVRVGQETTSSEAGERLATGSVVKVLSCDGLRVHYELLFGRGPASGWVSIRAGGRELIRKQGQASTVKPSEDSADVIVEDKEKVGQQAVALYAKLLEAGREAAVANGATPGFNRTAFPLWGQTSHPNKPEQVVRAELERDLGQVIAPEPVDAPADDVDSDGEAFATCCECGLPLGHKVYGQGKDNSKLMHAECQAQVLIRDMRCKEQSRLARQAEVKHERHVEFEIGWKAETIPRNTAAAETLGCDFVLEGLCCLKLQKDNTVQVTPTMEPAAAVNLEYLSTALQVRRVEGTEPLFSLDPVESSRPKDDRDDRDASMQMKRFEPEWLAGTTVGEVMFQADYHLKQLSMGEHEQPVLGMRSCMDICEEQDPNEEWSGREWFIVRKAEMQVSEDGVLIPFLKMGVEAREQIEGPSGLEDAPVTRPGHPLVRYAEAFTRNFDLIAERKGVVCQLREVAKASIMAKYLLESGTRLSESWFQLARAEDPACCMEVPQLWNDKCYSRITVKDGEIVASEDTKNAAHTVRGVYGGVDFGIDRFRLAAPSRVATSVVAGRTALARPASTLMATTAAGLSMQPSRQFTRLAGMSPMAPPSRLATPLSAMSLAAPMRAAAFGPQGVDLNLEKFNLSAATQVSAQAVGGAANLAVGSSFWAELDGGEGGEGVLSAEDRSLLKSVFNPLLSDRRAEGDTFAPPPTSHSHMQCLKRLVKEEDSLRQRRKDHFSSARFVVEEAGPLFPSSWTSSLQVSDVLAPGNLVERPEYKAEAAVLSAMFASTVPAFDKNTEEGARYRIYRVGSLEVRTLQDLGGEEQVCAVFSVSPAAEKPVWGMRRNRITEHDRFAKVTEFVERLKGGSVSRQSFVVLETEAGDAIVTERLGDGTAAWRENPANMEFRTSLAKVVRSAVGKDVCGTVGDMKKFQIMQDGRDGSAPSRSQCKRYAQLVFCKAVNSDSPVISGFHARRVGTMPLFRTAPKRPGLA